MGASEGSTRDPRWRLTAAGAIVVVLLLIVAGSVWRSRSGGSPTAGSPATEQLPIPADPTGPAAAANTGASVGEDSPASPMRWDVVRTGADDRQLVVHFDGGGCGTYRAEVTETGDAVSIQVLPVVREDDIVCPGVLAPAAIGVELSQPLGTRRLLGSRPTPGNDVPGPLVVPGEELATLTWPAGSVRATAEQLVRGLGPDAYVWTQTFTDPSVVIEPAEGSSDLATNPSVTLEQWHGATPIDDGAVYQTCRGRTGSTEPVDLTGSTAILVRCAGDEGPEPGSALAVLWMDGTDRLMVRAEPGPALDTSALLELARSVRRGG